MNKLGFLVIVILQISGLTQQASSGPELRIINGSPANNGNTKHIVSIRVKRYESRFGNGHICGGSLIGRNKVLTAAHCFFNLESKRFRKANEFIVVMGTMNRFQRVNGTIVSDVSSISYMNTFNVGNMRDDVGVMFLKTGLPVNKTHLTVEPIRLRNVSTPAGSICQIAGWGKTEKGSLSSVLLSANVTIIQRSICSGIYGNNLKDGMICAGSLLGTTDSCQGDSGGPLVYNDTLVGVVSWGNGCAELGFPGVYADVNYYYDWIMTRSGSSTLKFHLLSIIITFSFCLYRYFFVLII